MDTLEKDILKNPKDESINTATHMVGAIFALFGGVLLITKSVQEGSRWHVISFIIYSFTLVALFTMSALYHGINGSEKTNRRLRKLDHAAIYALITGTIVPVCLVLFRGYLGFTALAIALLVTALGVTLCSVVQPLPSYISFTLYLSLGWLPALLVLLDRSAIPPGGLLWLLAGGLFYSFGSTVLGNKNLGLFKGKIGSHELWHIAVLLGALCHFLFMYWYVLPTK